MSASSSTMRISDGIGLSLAGNFGFIEVRNGLGGSVHILRRVRGWRRALDLRLELQAHPGAAFAGEFFRGVAQFDAAAMVLENAADDGEPQPGALFAGRAIGLEQPVPVFLRQADAVVDDVD